MNKKEALKEALDGKWVRLKTWNPKYGISWVKNAFRYRDESKVDLDVMQDGEWEFQRITVKIEAALEYYGRGARIQSRVSNRTWGIFDKVKSPISIDEAFGYFEVLDA